MNIPKLSVFKSLFNSKETPYTLTILDVYERIKNGYSDLNKKIERLRAMDENTEEHRSLKNSLLAIMFNGTFNERNDNGLVEHSGLCVLDFDDYPDAVTMDAERQRLENCPFVYLVFTSPGGKGLKVVIKIPKSTKDEHKRRFQAFEKYIQSDYFDKTSCNVSRVCFESFDPEAYINEFCQEFTDIEQEKGFDFTEKAPTCILTDEDKIIDRIMKFDFGCSFIEGSRNAYIFKVAACFCEYNISKDTAEYYLKANFISKSFTLSELILTIKSAYKKASPGIKYFENVDLVQKVKLKLKQGVNLRDIKKQLNVDEDVIDDIKTDLSTSEDIFWIIEQKKTGETITIEPLKYAEFLVKNGFNKYYPENAEKPTFVRVQENKVRLSSADQIKDFVLQFLMSRGEIKVWNYCSKSTYLFNENHLNMIDSIGLKMLQDTKDVSLIPFRNGVAKVTKNSVVLQSYIDVEGYIWENQILDRDFIPVDEYNNDFQDLISKVSAENPERITALESTLGYLLHTFKDKTDQKAIIFNDQEIDDNANGGSGKSLMLTALSYIRKIVKIDGKAFNSKGDFVYQRVNLDTQVLAFDDVKKNFDFEQLFSLISEGITVNRKNKDEIFIPFERSPKIIITTNYVIAGAGSSHDRRRHELEFFQYFNAKKSPLELYGRLLFDSWSVDDWMKFDNYMIRNLQKFLKYGLKQSISINADSKRFIQATSKDFFDFVNDGHIESNVRHYNNASIQLFQQETNGWKDLESRRYLKWISEYAKYKNLDLRKERDHGGRFFELIDEDSVTNQGDIWDEINKQVKQ
jgi:hypothetical protein